MTQLSRTIRHTDDLMILLARPAIDTEWASSIRRADRARRVVADVRRERPLEADLET
jgi:hypothetical protein